MNNKGLMKIKLLSIILIIGMFIFLGVPKFVAYFNNRSKDNYIEIAKEYIKEVKNNINTLIYKQIPFENEALLVKLSNLEVNKKSPYGSFKDDYSYVIVLNRGSYYEYYFAGIDSSMHGIPVVSEQELNRESIVFGQDNLSSINSVNMIENLNVANTIFSKSNDTKEDDKNILLIPLSGELTVTYEFKKDVHKIYDNTIKNIDTSIYNKEVTINGGEVKYNNKIISSGYMKDINGLFRYISFPNNNKKDYYASFVSYNNSYVAGVINGSRDYSSKNMVFDSLPTITINKSASTVIENDKKYLMWNLMALYPNNDNYVITECGALIIKNNSKEEINLTFDTSNVLVGKSNNNCELGNIFAIRKDNVKTNDNFSARGYIKYKDKLDNEYIAYSRDTILGTVN